MPNRSADIKKATAISGEWDEHFFQDSQEIRKNTDPRGDHESPFNSIPDDLACLQQ